MDGWNTSFLLGWPFFRCYVSFRQGNFWNKNLQTDGNLEDGNFCRWNGPNHGFSNVFVRKNLISYKVGPYWDEGRQKVGSHAISLLSYVTSWLQLMWSGSIVSEELVLTTLPGKGRDLHPDCCVCLCEKQQFGGSKPLLRQRFLHWWFLGGSLTRINPMFWWVAFAVISRFVTPLIGVKMFPFCYSSKNDHWNKGPHFHSIFITIGSGSTWGPICWNS